MGKLLFTLVVGVSENRVVKSIRGGLISIMPVMLVGAFIILFVNIPHPNYQAFMAEIFGVYWNRVALNIYDGTLSIMSLMALIAISHSLAASTNECRKHAVNPAIVTIVSLCCLMTLTNISDGMISVWVFGNIGLFVAIVTAISVHFLFFFFFRHRRFKINLGVDTTDAQMIQALHAVEPTLATLIVFSVLRFAFYQIGVSDVHLFVNDMFRQIAIFFDNRLITALFFSVMTHILWIFGLHGANILENMAESIWVSNDANILTKEFFDVFAYMGGSGATLCLITAFLIVGKKRSQSLRLAKFSLPLGLANINETLVYGLPIVLNPFFILPFIFVPVILILNSYVLTYIGIVPLTVNEVMWTSPPIIGGYLATNSIIGSLLQIINLAIGTIIYIPFIKMSFNYKDNKNSEVLKQLFSLSEKSYVEIENQQALLFSRSDDIGVLARSMAEDMKNDLCCGVRLYLEYQPQIDNDGQVVGVEALLRWEHERFGKIPPPVILAIAEEAGLDEQLNGFVFKTAMTKLSKLQKLGYSNIVMSINLSPKQLHSQSLLDMIKLNLTGCNVSPEYIKIEMTENVALVSSPKVQEIFLEFAKIGIKLAIDDFGMGHSSLLYLRKFDIHTIKLDGSLTQDIENNRVNEEIVHAITNLSKSMGISVIAEFVETKSQRDKLKELGCDIYQGFFYARPLSDNNLLEYLKEMPA